MKYCIGFSTQPNNIFSKLIRWFTRSKASHSFIFLNAKIILEATDFKVKATAYSKFKKKNKIIAVYEIIQDPIILQKALDTACEELGVDYDVFNIIGIAIVIIVDMLTHIRIKNPLDSKNKLQCSEYVLQFIKDGQIPIELNDEEFIDSQILIDFCNNNIKYFKPMEI